MILTFCFITYSKQDTEYQLQKHCLQAFREGNELPFTTQGQLPLCKYNSALTKHRPNIMEKFSLLLKELNDAKSLTRSQMKEVRGGSGSGGSGSGGNCVKCVVTGGGGSGSTSCWYTNSSPNDLCSRVYPSGSGTAQVVTCTSDCHMN